MILSPTMTYVIDKEAEGFPSPSEREKLNKAIGRYRLILKTIAWRYDIGEIKFALADLLIGRNDPGDYEEASKYYDDILNVVPDSYLKAKVIVGKAELLISSSKPGDVEKALEMCDEAIDLIDGGEADFFVCKANIVKAELLLKRAVGGDRDRAVRLFDHIVKNRKAHWYFKARAQIGLAELIEYKKTRDLSRGIGYCDEAIDALKERPHDYFTTKAKVVKGELLSRRGQEKDIRAALQVFRSILRESATLNKDLVARVKLDMAELPNSEDAEKLYGEVSMTGGLDPYLIEKARLIEQGFKASSAPRRRRHSS